MNSSFAVVRLVHQDVEQSALLVRRDQREAAGTPLFFAVLVIKHRPGLADVDTGALDRHVEYLAGIRYQQSYNFV